MESVKKVHEEKIVTPVKEVVSNIDTDAIKAKGRNIIDIILDVYAKPYDTCKEETENK